MLQFNSILLPLAILASLFAARAAGPLQEKHHTRVLAPSPPPAMRPSPARSGEEPGSPLRPGARAPGPSERAEGASSGRRGPDRRLEGIPRSPRLTPGQQFPSARPPARPPAAGSSQRPAAPPPWPAAAAAAAAGQQQLERDEQENLAAPVLQSREAPPLALALRPCPAACRPRFAVVCCVLEPPLPPPTLPQGILGPSSRSGRPSRPQVDGRCPPLPCPPCLAPSTLFQPPRRLPARRLQRRARCRRRCLPPPDGSRRTMSRRTKLRSGSHVSRPRLASRAPVEHRLHLNLCCCGCGRSSHLSITLRCCRAPLPSPNVQGAARAHHAGRHRLMGATLRSPDLPWPRLALPRGRGRRPLPGRWPRPAAAAAPQFRSQSSQPSQLRQPLCPSRGGGGVRQPLNPCSSTAR